MIKTSKKERETRIGMKEIKVGLKKFLEAEGVYIERNSYLFSFI